MQEILMPWQASKNFTDRYILTSISNDLEDFHFIIKSTQTMNAQIKILFEDLIAAHRVILHPILIQKGSHCMINPCYHNTGPLLLVIHSIYNGSLKNHMGAGIFSLTLIFSLNVITR